jgi:hypothetical protein
MQSKNAATTIRFCTKTSIFSIVVPLAKGIEIRRLAYAEKKILTDNDWHQIMMQTEN